MKTLLLTLLLLCSPIVAQEEDFDLPGASNEQTRQELKRAWLRAREIGGVPRWDFPDNLSVISYDGKVMRVVWDWNGQKMKAMEIRTYGHYFEMYGINPDTGNDVTNRYIILYLRASELERLGPDILVHEMLHYIFIQRCRGEQAFFDKFGHLREDGGEAWIRHVFPFDPGEDHAIEM